MALLSIAVPCFLTLAVAEGSPQPAGAGTVDNALAGVEAGATADEVPAEPAEVDPAALEAQWKQKVASFEAGLDKRRGIVNLGDGLAAMKVSDSFDFVGPAEAAAILVNVWGNPPGPEPLGMLLPADTALTDDAGWGVVIQYSEDGHVKDDDAAGIDYDDLLASMQESTQSSNEARIAAGYPAIELVGWAEPPHYDAQAKKLYWAKELQFEGNEGVSSLNYSIRILGRKGVLELNAVADMAQLESVRAPMEEVLDFTAFASGNTYADFDPEIDTVAAYGIGGLIAGKVLMKAGFFKALIAGLFAFKKFILIGGVAVGGVVLKLLGRRKNDD